MNSKILTENNPVAPINLFIHSLFSQVDVSLNEIIVLSSTYTYPYRAYIELLLNYGEDAKKSLLTCEDFCKDTHLQQSNPLAEEDANEGLEHRYELCKLSRTMDMFGQLHCDIFQQNNLLLNLVDLKIKVMRSKLAFCLMAYKNDIEYLLNRFIARQFVYKKIKVGAGVLLGQVKA